MENENKFEVEEAQANDAQAQTNNTQVEEGVEDYDDEMEDERSEGAKKASSSLALGLIATLFSIIGIFVSVTRGSLISQFIVILSIVLSILGIVQAVSAKYLGCDENKGSRTAGLFFSILALIICFIGFFESTIFFYMLFGAFL